MLREVVSERTLEWLSECLGSERMQLYTPIPDVLREAEEVVRRSYRVPRIRKLDLPEALCLVMGKRYGYVVLTENRAALMYRRVDPEYSGVRVWRALEVLAEAVRRGLVDCSGPEGVRGIFKRYEEETGHIFPRRELEEVLGGLNGRR